MNCIIAESMQFMRHSWPYGETLVRFVLGDRYFEAKASYEPITNAEGQLTGDNLLRIKIEESV